jgi:mannitol/fructose-specific phosphotransferase system IIA component (Ntr-type)
MRLTEFIAEEHIAPQLQATTKAEALAELTALLLGGWPRIRQKEALEKILSREAIDSTGIGSQIAVPHAPTHGLTQLACAIGRSSKGLDFKSIDKDPVRLVFLVCYPPDQQTVYLNFLATVAQLLRDRDAVEAMLEAATAMEIRQQIDVHSKSMINPEDQGSSPREVSASGESAGGGVVCSEIVLLARLELCVDMLEMADSGQDEIRRRIENIKALLDPATVRRFEQLKRAKRRAVVAVEGQVCQGCFVQLPVQLARVLRSEEADLQNCLNCNRFIFSA